MRSVKAALNVSKTHFSRMKRYQEYFDHEKTFAMTPNSRSLPKKKPLNQAKLSNKKVTKKFRESVNVKKNRKVQGSPLNRHRASRHDHSINREYDSPSKQNDDLDFILADRPKTKKVNGLAQATIDKVYQQLTNNHLSESIQILEGALKIDESNYDMNYLLGVCYLIKGSYDQAINIFDTLLERKARKNIYLLLSVCYKKMEDYDETEKILNQCLRKNPKSYEAYIYRGKLFLRLRKYREALADFERAIKISPQKQIGYVGKGDCLRLSERYEQAKSIYAKALHMSKKTNTTILLRRAICNMELKRYDPAFDDIQEILSIDEENSQALYFKGLIFNKQKMQNEAIICYEQAIKFNSNKKAVTRSIYELTKIKIEHRDYYEALYTLQRAKFLDIEEKVIRKFKIFADGVTEMMKKNFEEGVRILGELLDDPEKPAGSFLKPLLYSSRSYGYMSLNKFQQARDDLEKLEAEFSLDIPNLYNKFICEGILACNSQKYEQALSFFSKASKIMPSRIEPYYYKAVTLICFVSKLIPKEMKSKQEQYLQSALKTIMKCDKQIENNPSLFLVRGFIYYALGEAEKGLQDLDKCMNQSIKHLPINLYLNGLILSEHFGRYEDAIQEFKKALSTEEDHKIPEIYLNKAKCLLLNGEVNGGFVQLQTYMSFRPSSPQIHIWAGHLLFYIGAAEDAAKAYSNINNINKNTEVLFYRAKCYLHFKDVINTLANLKLILDAKYDNKIFFDYHVLDALRECSEDETVDYAAVLNKIKETKERSESTGEGKFGKLFKESDYQFYKAVMYFFCKDYEKASKNFERALKLSEEQISKNVQNNSQCLEFYKLSYNNIPFNYFQCLYNAALSDLMAGNIMKGIKKLKLACDKCPEDQDTKNQLLLFIHHLEKEIKNQFNPNREEEAEPAQLSPFPYDNRLCSIFPEFLIPLSTPIQTRLFFCLPSVSKPDIRPRFDEKLFDQITMATIEIKPQAPWIRRSEEGVIFTDEVVGVDVTLSPSSSSEEESDQQEDEEEEDEGEPDEDEIYEHRSDEGQREAPINRSDLKDFFKLDPSVEARLARLR